MTVEYDNFIPGQTYRFVDYPPFQHERHFYGVTNVGKPGWLYSLVLRQVIPHPELLSNKVVLPFDSLVVFVENQFPYNMIVKWDDKFIMLSWERGGGYDIRCKYFDKVETT